MVGPITSALAERKVDEAGAEVWVREFVGK